MFRLRLSTVICATVICLVALAATQADTVEKRNSKGKRHPTPVWMRAEAYALPDETRILGAYTPEDHRVPLVTPILSSSSASPGVAFGSTWMDTQHNATVGRMIGTGPHSGVPGLATVHFSWMYLPDSLAYRISRSYAYNAYVSATGSFVGETILHDLETHYSGMVNLWVTPDNRAVVGGHDSPVYNADNQAQIHFDACPACASFATYVRVPDSLAIYQQNPDDGDCAIWPKFLFQLGTDTVVHVLARINPTVDGFGAATMYFRNVGYEGSGEWVYPPYVVDSNAVLSHDISGEYLGDRVGMVWTASLPYEEPSCDTCSSGSIYGYTWVGTLDNDIYLQTSSDQGVTWEPRQNITKYPIGEAGHKAIFDASILFDQSDVIHLVWHTQPWPADTCVDQGGWCFVESDDWSGYEARIVHWSESDPYIRTVCDHTYDPSINCAPGAWSANVAKMILSECDGKLYCIWSQFNDIPGGIDDDCAQWGYNPDGYRGAANAELWVSVSSDGGLTWDAQRNLTNSYTPNCDPYGGYDCHSEHWASMTPHGRQVQIGEDWSGSVTVDPSGGTSPTDWYLDIQFVDDLDAGGMPRGEGGFTNNPMRWFRMPCVEPVASAMSSMSETLIEDFMGTLPGTQKDTTVTLENFGNTDLGYTITVEEDNGVAAAGEFIAATDDPVGWLAYSGFSGTVPAGLDNTETGTIHLNYGGVINYQTWLTGRLIFDGNDARFPDTIEIELWVGPPPEQPTWDIVNTSCLSLNCSSHGNVGSSGWGESNMDYYPEDCDSTADIYLADGSVLFGRDNGAYFNSIIWGISYRDPSGLRPQGGHMGTKYCADLDAEVFESGTFTTQDSTIAFEKIWVAPSDDCQFILEYLRVWSYDGASHSGLLLGELVDWDVPYDLMEGNTTDIPYNTGGVNSKRNLLYQRGYECYCDNNVYPHNCVFNDMRYAGNAFIQSYFNGVPRDIMPYGGFVGEVNQVLTEDGFDQAMMWSQMNVPGLRGIGSTGDLYTGMCFENNLTLGPDDYYEVVTVLATTEQGGLTDLQKAVIRAGTWFEANGGIGIFNDGNEDGQIDLCEGCCALMADVNHDGQVNAADLAYLSEWLLGIGPPPPCPDEADLDYNGEVDALDLVILADCLRRPGRCPSECP
ncbi:MAG: dockerin type I repeat-containing protein [Candidatus Zixiibacteriota bacterium]|nr:MAG: dockerin type I repeat-containing protein [candidate division Zixibacteria bacterium]